MKEEAPLCKTLTPIKRIKAALSCSRTYFTVVPEENIAISNNIGIINRTEKKVTYHSEKQYDLKPMFLRQPRMQLQVTVLLAYQTQ